MERDKRGLSFLEGKKNGTPSPGGMGGPSVTGKYINIRTGKEIFVRDCFDSGHGIQCMLSDDSMIPMSELSRDYVIIDDVNPAYQQTNEPTNLYEIDREVVKEMPTVERPSLDTIISNGTQVRLHDNTVEKSASVLSSHIEMINQILNKVKGPSITIKIDWACKPVEQFNMLKEFFDVKDEEIVSALMSKYGKLEALEEAFSEILK